MSDLWYETVGPAERLTQGDIISDCPLLSWSPSPIQVAGSGSQVEALKQGRVAFQADVIVMTQACAPRTLASLRSSTQPDENAVALHDAR
jgi:hypothetical protein